MLEHDGFQILWIFPEQSSLELRARFSVVARKKQISILPRIAHAIVLFLTMIGLIDFLQAAWHVAKVIWPRLLFIMVLVCAAVAQETHLPDAPVPQAKTKLHRFMDWQDGIELGGAAVGIVFDSLSTQHMVGLHCCHEGNPFAKPFVGSRRGQAFISAAGFGAEIGGMYLAHRKHWYRTEQLIPFLSMAYSAWAVTNNFRIVDKYSHATTFQPYLRVVPFGGAR